ncbi:MAG: DUF1559 domain-containing protein [Planctomycetaceae bacterium]
MSDNPYQEPAQDVPGTKGLAGTLLKLFGVFAAVLILLALLPASRRGREPARRTQCRNNLKQIGLALHNYHDVYDAFPPAYTVDSDGKPLHSWRTLILPYLGEQQLYGSIDLSKAWNDPANAPAFETSVSAFRCPSTSTPLNQTTYLAIAAPHGCFRPVESRTISEITDGTSNTLMVIEVSPNKAVHWMEPRDDDGTFVLNFEPDSDLAHSGGSQGLFADGSVTFLSAEMSMTQRRVILTVAGNDETDDDLD